MHVYLNRAETSAIMHSAAIYGAARGIRGLAA
jgi:hypothetical protein